MLDARIQTMDNQADRFVTKEKKRPDRRLLYQVAHQRLQPLLPRQPAAATSPEAEVLLKRKFSDRLRSEIGRLDVKDIVTDSRGRLTLGSA